ncbi:hypothetical protein NDU88_011988, partial [Pleurodeles waltl]
MLCTYFTDFSKAENLVMRTLLVKYDPTCYVLCNCYKPTPGSIESRTKSSST